VIVRSLNDDEIPDFVRFAREKEVAVRFIEFMPLDEDENWNRDRVVTGKEMFERIESEQKLLRLRSASASETSENFGFPDSGGSIGFITSVSNPFCSACSRIRLTADGKIRNCLFSSHEYEIKSLLRSSASDGEIREHIQNIVNRKEKGHRINEEGFQPPPRSMSYIGG
jgi:cyclic pyranopterin phosphate synthase